MNKEQAKQIIKTVLDQATKAGVLNTIDAAATVAQAWQTLTQELTNNENTNA